MPEQIEITTQRPPRPIPDGAFWDVQQAAAYLNVSPSWIRDHASGRRRPALPCVRLGARCMRFDPTAVLEFVRGLGR